MKNDTNITELSLNPTLSATISSDEIEKNVMSMIAPKCSSTPLPLKPTLSATISTNKMKKDIILTKAPKYSSTQIPTEKNGNKRIRITNRNHKMYSKTGEECFIDCYDKERQKLKNRTVRKILLPTKML